MAEKVRGKAEREIRDTSCDRLCQKTSNVERGELKAGAKEDSQRERLDGRRREILERKET